MTETTIPIPARLKNVAQGGHVAGSEDIDAGGNKNQKQVNDDVNLGIQIINDKIGPMSGNKTINKRLDDLEAAESITYEGGEAQIAQGSDFTNPDATKRAKIPTVGAIVDGLNDGIYDVSKRNPTAGPNSDGKFTLDYILNNANTLIPTGWRHGGMSISFVQSSDNKYKQYRLMSDTFSTTESDWQGVDDKPTAGSDNLVKSGGVYKLLDDTVSLKKTLHKGAVSIDGHGRSFDRSDVLLYNVTENDFGRTIAVSVGTIVTDLPNETMVQLNLLDENNVELERINIKQNETKQAIIDSEDIKKVHVIFFASVASASTSNYTYKVNDVDIYFASGIFEIEESIKKVNQRIDDADDEPTAGSNNIVKSGGVYELLDDTVSLEKILYNGTPQLTGNGTKFRRLSIYEHTVTEDEVGKIASVSVGTFVTNLPNETMVQLNTYDANSHEIDRINIAENEKKSVVLSSDVISFAVIFYASVGSNSTNEYTYKVNNLKVVFESGIIELKEGIKNANQNIENLNEKTKGIGSLNPWVGKNVVLYGDSIVGLGNGDNPGTTSFMYWAKQALEFANLYQRGVGGQSYKWNTYGWYTKVGTNGRYLDRAVYDAQGQQTANTLNMETITAQDITNIEAKYNCNIDIHYGAFCSWDRIKAMIPAAIKDTIDLIVLCGGTNDFPLVEEVAVQGDMSAAEPQWISNDVTDPTWAADTTYYKGGDYDISTFVGAIASAIMKMQVWCPNAVVALATPFPNFNGTTKEQSVNTHNVSFRRMCGIEKAAAEFVCTTVIDANGKCGINGVSYNSYVTDGTHPNAAGLKMFGRVFVNELPTIGKKID